MTHPLDWRTPASQVSERGVSAERSATAAECDDLARALELVRCNRLLVKYRIVAAGGGRYTLAGDLEADIVQTCVVSLEPVDAVVRQKFDVEFRAEPVEDDGTLSERDALSVPEIEPLDNGVIDAGRIVFETLAAGLDPYPKRPDAAFEWRDPVQDAPGAKSPFSALHRLKPKS